MKLCKVLTNATLKGKGKEKKKRAKVVSRALHLARAQVSQYSRNSLIKQRAKPNQTPLDFSLAQRGRAAALPRSHCTQSAHRPDTLCNVLYSRGSQPFLAFDPLEMKQSLSGTSHHGLHNDTVSTSWTKEWNICMSFFFLISLRILNNIVILLFMRNRDTMYGKSKKGSILCSSYCFFVIPYCRTTSASIPFEGSWPAGWEPTLYTPCN